LAQIRSFSCYAFLFGDPAVLVPPPFRHLGPVSEGALCSLGGWINGGNFEGDLIDFLGYKLRGIRITHGAKVVSSRDRYRLDQDFIV